MHFEINIITQKSLANTMRTMRENNKKTGSTSTLLHELFTAPDIGNFLSTNSDDFQVLPFHKHITNLASKKGVVPEQVIKKSGIERTYGHQLFNGTRNPSRDKIIQLAFGLRLTLDETQKLLIIGKRNPLYPRIKRDAAIIFCLNHKKDLFETQTMLQSLELTLLGEK